MQSTVVDFLVPPFSHGHYTVSVSRAQESKRNCILLRVGQSRVTNKVNKHLFPQSGGAGEVDLRNALNTPIDDNTGSNGSAVRELYQSVGADKIDALKNDILSKILFKSH